MKRLSTNNIVLSGLFIALGFLLPFLTGQIPSIGSRLLPMHIPVMLCGFICGWPYGIIVGFITPLFRSVVFGTPPMYPTAVAMAFELAAYGFASGFMYELLCNRSISKNISIYISLIFSMVCGRIIWGMASYILYGLRGTAFTWERFVARAFIDAVPGIIIQVIIIPVIIIALRRAKVFG
ncbi:MAG: ECF transporter S component [Clostridiaceae bacterium]|nr:ECF transporter S component [Clostridiaceae bacterium]